jgi:hypothetical protein
MKRPRGYVALGDFANTFIPAVREAAEDQGIIKRKQCEYCEKFFALYKCNKMQFECDCPKCQGYCECPSN